jgi:hypothetical protein
MKVTYMTIEVEEKPTMTVRTAVRTRRMMRLKKNDGKD